MNVTIINDCRDANAIGRQSTRCAGYFNGNISFVGVSNDLEASGNIIDTLDAYGNAQGVLLVNVAPRNGSAKKWHNGTPFGYFWHKNVLVVSSIDGFVLSLVRTLNLTNHVHILDIPTSMKTFVSEGILSAKEASYVVSTQFRSYEFLPRIAAYLLQHKEAVSENVPITDFLEAPNAVWWIDNFGNCKTTVMHSEEASEIRTRFGTLPYFKKLKDVPDGTIAAITGSSGIGSTRFLEIVMQGGSAAQSLGISSGDTLF